MSALPNDRLFAGLNLATIIAVYLLILAGGIVRSTGSGMGCPDWPKCFGSYIPPTSAAELPENYKEIYSQKRHQKNLRVAKMMKTIGLVHLADKISKDESILVEQDFNVLKTWIEYINRMLGVLVGAFILASFVKSFSFWSTHRNLIWISCGALILVIFQGWVGSVVVSTNLLPGIITFHMLLAIGLIAILLNVRYKLKRKQEDLVPKKVSGAKFLMTACIILFLTQVGLGTQVREAVDNLTVQLGEAARTDWIENLGLTFFIHRSYSLILLGLHIALVIELLRKFKLSGTTKKLVLGLIILTIMEMVTGVILAYMALPYFIQPVHLFLALLIFGVLYYLSLMLKKPKTKTAHAI